METSPTPPRWLEGVKNNPVPPIRLPAPPAHVPVSESAPKVLALDPHAIAGAPAPASFAMAEEVLAAREEQHHSHALFTVRSLRHCVPVCVEQLSQFDLTGEQDDSDSSSDDDDDVHELS
jgi:hypothetical protein